MSNGKYTQEFKEEAIKQIKERGYKVSEVSKRLGVSAHSLYKWLKQGRGNNGRHSKDHAEALRQENLRLKNELKRVEEERDILKKAQRTLQKNPGKVRIYYGSSGRISG